MCLFSEAELNCVSTNMRLILLLMQLLMGISTKRYLPAMGTAGLLRVAVKGYNLLPAPPPKITATVDLLIIIVFISFGTALQTAPVIIWIDILEYTFPHCFPNCGLFA
jgi:hypothetical protein